MKRLIHKHTRPGNLIFDACACSGVLSAIATECGRKWVYAESNAANYDLDVGRIALTQPLETVVAGVSARIGVAGPQRHQHFPKERSMPLIQME